MASSATDIVFEIQPAPVLATPAPTTAKCGSARKIEVMTARFAAGESLFHPDDANERRPISTDKSVEVIELDWDLDARSSALQFEQHIDASIDWWLLEARTRPDARPTACSCDVCQAIDIEIQEASDATDSKSDIEGQTASDGDSE